MSLSSVYETFFFKFLGQKGEGLVLVLGHVEEDGHALAHLPGLFERKFIVKLGRSDLNWLLPLRLLSYIYLGEEIKTHSLFTLAFEWALQSRDVGNITTREMHARFLPFHFARNSKLRACSSGSDQICCLLFIGTDTGVDADHGRLQDQEITVAREAGTVKNKSS